MVLDFRPPLSQGRNGGLLEEKINRKLTNSLLLLEVVCFADSPAIICFSESLDSCSMISLQGFQLLLVGARQSEG